MSVKIPHANVPRERSSGRTSQHTSARSAMCSTACARFDFLEINPIGCVPQVDEHTSTIGCETGTCGTHTHTHTHTHSHTHARKENFRQELREKNWADCKNRPKCKHTDRKEHQFLLEYLLGSVEVRCCMRKEVRKSPVRSAACMQSRLSTVLSTSGCHECHRETTSDDAVGAAAAARAIVNAINDGWPCSEGGSMSWSPARRLSVLLPLRSTV